MDLLIDGRCLRHSHTTGVQRYVVEVVKAFDRLGLPHTVVMPKSQSRLCQQLWEHVILARRAKDFDVLFCPSNVAPICVTQKVKLVVTLHCLRFLRIPKAYRSAFRLYYRILIPRVLKRAEAIITVSNTTADEIEQYYPQAEGKIHVVRPGVGPEFTPGDSGSSEPYILYVGSLSPAKNLSRLLAAFSRLTNQFHHRLIIVGAKSPALHGSGLAQGNHRVSWLGAIEDPRELARMYRQADLLVFPSLYESFGLPAIEAMACGTPVLASDLPSLRETMGDAGVYFDPTSSDEMAERIGQILSDVALQRYLRTAGIRRAAAFSWDNCAKKIWGIVNDV